MAAGVYTGGGATVVMDPPPVVYAEVFHRGSGPERDLLKRSNQVAIFARTLAPSRTGRLKGSIKVSQNRDEKGRFAFGFAVYSSTPYATYVHEGTGPSIRVKHPGAMRWQGDSGPVFAKVVFHPGTPRNPFLRDALVMAG